MVDGPEIALPIALRAFLVDGLRARRLAPSTQSVISRCAVAFSVSASLAAEVAAPSEAELKAAFIYNFIKFTEWPAEEMAKTSEPFIIGMFGKDPFGAALDKTVEGDSFHQKPVVVRRYSRMDESVGTAKCSSSALRKKAIFRRF